MAGTFGQIRNAIRHHRKISEQKYPNDEHYQVDRSHTSLYFSQHRKWEEKIRSYFKELHKRGKQAVHVDICGRTIADDLGADRSYCFALKMSEYQDIISRAISDADNVFIEGDLFNTRDFSKLIQRLKEDGIHPALVTFEPIVGLQQYDPFTIRDPNYKEVTYGQLEKRLKTMIAISLPGGYIYLDKPFQSDGTADFFKGKCQKDYEISLRLKRIARQQKCRIEIGQEFSGPYFLLNKRA